MPIIRTAMIDDDGSGTTGTVLNNAWKQELYDQVDGLFGVWQTFPHAPGNFVAASGTWTVPTALPDYTYRYMLIEKTMWISLYLANTTLSVSSAYLRLKIPRGIGSRVLCLTSAFQPSTGWAVQTASQSVVGGTELTLYTLSGAPLAAGTMDLAMNGTIPIY
jgi:hypothetical protein